VEHNVGASIHGTAGKKLILCDVNAINYKLIDSFFCLCQDSVFQFCEKIDAKSITEAKPEVLVHISFV
jgi:hypothetical protein